VPAALGLARLDEWYTRVDLSNAPVAQGIEHPPPKRGAGSSILPGRATYRIPGDTRLTAEWCFLDEDGSEAGSLKKTILLAYRPTDGSSRQVLREASPRGGYLLQAVKSVVSPCPKCPERAATPTVSTFSAGVPGLWQIAAF
jgi:hypothetical protein